jgi:hypothetical protein
MMYYWRFGIGIAIEIGIGFYAWMHFKQKFRIPIAIPIPMTSLFDNRFVFEAADCARKRFELTQMNPLCSTIVAGQHDC